MKIRYLKLKNWLLLGIMSLLGLQACHSHKRMAKEQEKARHDEEEPMVLMYGGIEVTYNEPVPLIRKDTVTSPEKDVTTGDVDAKDRPRPREPEVTVYGVPTVDYTVKGRVVDNSGRPIKGLQVLLVTSEIDPDNLPDNKYWRERLARMSDTTDQKGNFEVHATDNPWEKQRVMVMDIDGAKNGSYETQLVDVQFEDNGNGGSMSQWKLGERGAEVTVKMKRKK